MDKTINSYINQLHLDPKREAAVRKLVTFAGGSGSESNNTDKNVLIAMISEDVIADAPESYVNTIKSISDVVSYDNPTYISTDIAHNILDLNARIIIKGTVRMLEQAEISRAYSPLCYIYKGVYYNFKDIENMRNEGYNIYNIIFNGVPHLQIIHVINEDAFENLGEEFNKLGFYIVNTHPS